MALLDGSNVFGYAVECSPPVFNERREQRAAYPGLNGIESLDMGDAGAISTVSGRLLGANLGALIAAEAALMSFFDGLTHTLTDNDGTSWPNVKMMGAPKFEKGQTSVDGYSRRYTVTFFHLTLG